MNILKRRGKLFSSAIVPLTVINTQTDSYTLTMSDIKKLINMNKGSACDLTIPPNADVAFPIGTEISFYQGGAGQVTVVPGSGVTVNSASSYTKTAAQYAPGCLIKVATNTWLLSGNLTT